MAVVIPVAWAQIRRLFVTDTSHLERAAPKFQRNLILNPRNVSTLLYFYTNGDPSLGFTLSVFSFLTVSASRMKQLYRICPLLCLTLCSVCYASFHGRKVLDAVTKSTDGQQQQSFDGPFKTTRPSIDPNLVLILAALLCALFFGLGLNLIIRCTLCLSALLRFNVIARRGNVRGTNHVTVGLGAAGGNTGLKKAVVDALPVAVYGTVGCPVTECVICLREFAEGEKMRVLPVCNHRFHVECIDRWFVSHSLCPICRGHMAEAVDKKPQASLPCSSCGHNESTAERASENAVAVRVEAGPSISAPGSGSGTDIEAVGRAL